VKGGAAEVEVRTDMRQSGRGGGGPILGLQLEIEFVSRGGCEAMETYLVIL
jgi:hypothetical protein